MMLGLSFVILATLAAIVVAAPFLSRRNSNKESDTGVEVYKDQLAEIERDLEQGAIGKEEADLARVEIERRILNTAKASDQTAHSLGIGWHYRIVTGVAAIVVLGSIGIYATINHADRFYAQQARNASMPQQPEQTQQAAAADQQAQLREVEDMMNRLKKRVADNPDDGDSWRVLAWSYYNTGQYDKSVEAYQRAADLQKDNALVRALLGEAMVKAASGRVTDDALAIFEEVIALNPNDERARFFKGMAQEQKGNPQGAVDEWIKLYENAPEDADWASDLRQRIEEVAKANNIDVTKRLASLKKPAASAPQQAASQQRGPSAEDVESARQMAPQDRQAMVRGMVDGLAARLEGSPNDPQGWIMLIRSHMALNEPDKARAALERASKALADTPESLKQIADAAKVMGISDSSDKN